MKNYEEFKKAVIEAMQIELPEYDSFKVEQISKAGVTYDGLMIRNKDHSRCAVIPMINLTDAFEQYQDGASFTHIIQKMVDIRKNAGLGSEFNPSDILYWDKVENRIMPRLINTEANKSYVNTVIHKDMADLSIIYYVIVKDDGNGMATATITNDLAKEWGKSVDDIHNTAVRNLGQSKVFFQNIEELLFSKMMGTEGGTTEVEDIEIDKYRTPFFILSNEHKVKGAAMVLNTEFMTRVAEKFGGSMFVIPSSVDEVLVAPKKYIDDALDLITMVREVNEQSVKPEDQLSNNVYTWSIEDGFKMVNAI